MHIRFACFAALVCYSAYAEVPEEVLVAKTSEYFLTRSDNLPVENFEDSTDPYLEGYIQALVDMNYYEMQVVVVVNEHDVYLYNLPNNPLIAESIMAFVRDLP